jgi:hypothetical protein
METPSAAPASFVAYTAMRIRKDAQTENQRTNRSKRSTRRKKRVPVQEDETADQQTMGPTSTAADGGN